MKLTPYKWLSFILCIILLATPLATFSLAKKYRDIVTTIQKNAQNIIKRRTFAPFIQTFFPPQDNVRPLLRALLEEETERIDIEAFQLTDKGIAESILTAYNRGVKINIIADISALGRYSKMLQLHNVGIPIYIYPPQEEISSPSQRYTLMHNKIMLFHSLSCIITGSTNFTKSGLESNQENLLIIQDQTIFKEYQRQFEWLTKQATPLGYMS